MKKLRVPKGKEFPALGHAAMRILRRTRRTDQTLAELTEFSADLYKGVTSATVFRQRINGGDRLLLEQQFTLERKPEKGWRTRYTAEILEGRWHPAVIAVNDQKYMYVDKKGVVYTFNFVIGDRTADVQVIEGIGGGTHQLFAPMYTEDRRGNIEIQGLLSIKGRNLGVRGSREKGDVRIVESAELTAGITSLFAQIIDLKTDSLTGLASRRDFNRDIEEMIKVYREEGRQFTLLLLDIDHFKEVNDEYGHIPGDRVLQAFAETLYDSIRRTPDRSIHNPDFRPDKVYRFGGEEFVILLPDVTFPEAMRVAERIRKKVEEREVRVDGEKIKVTCSIGATPIERMGENIRYHEAPGRVGEFMFRQSDGGVYAAKDAGRNCIYYVEFDGEEYRIKPYSDPTATTQLMIEGT